MATSSCLRATPSTSPSVSTQEDQEPERPQARAKFGIPNDPTNGGRAAGAAGKGLIKLRPEAGLKATPLDVIDNPKKIKFVELDAAQLPRSLDDLTRLPSTPTSLCPQA